MGRYYLVFDAIVVLLLGGLLLALARAIRSTRPRHPTGLRIAGAAIVAVLGALLLALLLLGDPGWSVLFLSVPDLALVLLSTAVLLIAIGAFDLVRLVQIRRGAQPAQP